MLSKIADQLQRDVLRWPFPDRATPTGDYNYDGHDVTGTQ